MSLSVVSLCEFTLLNALLAWGLALLLWKRVRHRTKAVHYTVALMLAVSFAFGAAWFNLIHVRTFEPVPDNVPRGDNSPLGLAVFAGFVGVILLGLATLLGLAGYGLWDYLSGQGRNAGPK